MLNHHLKDWDVEGIKFPDIEMYALSSIVKTLTLWLNPSYSARWKQVQEHT